MRPAFARPLSAAVFAVVVGLPGIALADARSDLFTAYERLLGARFHGQTESTAKGGKASVSNVDYDTVQRVHLKSEHGEFVIVPEGTWMKNGDRWMQPPFDMSAMFRQLLPMTQKSMREDTHDVVDGGQVTWSGQSVRAISYDTAMQIMGIAVKSHTTVYIGADGRIIGSESEGTAMGTTTRTVQRITYDDGIRVSAPAG